MNRKLIALLLALALVFSMCALASCGSTKTSDETTAEDTSADDTVDYSSVKIGLITLHDENSTYDKNFIDALTKCAEDLGLSDDQIEVKSGIDESNACYDAALDLVDDGCNIVIADSFGHEDYIIQAAKECPDVTFCHATGTKAHTEGLDNFHNGFASIYEGRYLAGVAAGMKLNEMIADGEITEEECKVGYVGAYTYAEVISGYTSFFLGIQSECPSATMEVQFTGSWYDEAAEKEAATALINDGCVLISQHADSLGAPTACEDAGVPNVSYNGSTETAGPNTYIISSKIDWSVYYELVAKCVVTGEEIPADYTGTLQSGSVQVIALNENVAAEGTQDKLDEVQAELEAGTLHVFDTSKFTVAGEPLTTYLADVDTDANYEADTEVIADGYFHESEYRSAPYFDVQIDGITLLNAAY